MELEEDQIPQKPPLKWQGKATTELTGHNSDQIWPLISDFCSLHRWFPHVATCYALEGAAGEPGLIRYCASATVEDGQAATKWAKEKLVAIDPEEKWLSYEIVDNNAGFGAYAATLRVVDVGGEEGCAIEWSYVADPVAGLTAEGLMAFVDSTLGAMALRLQEALCSSATHRGNNVD